MASPMQDQRRYFRAIVHTNVEIMQDGIVHQPRATIRNLTEVGAFIETTPGCEIGAVLSLRFQLPNDSEELNCSAVVRHTKNGTGLGVEFLDLTTATCTRLQQFISREVDDYLSQHR